MEREPPQPQVMTSQMPLERYLSRNAAVQQGWKRFVHVYEMRAGAG
jgi:hypothetical protein